MSLWGDNPEYFEEWIEAQALNGKLGAEIQARVENGDLTGFELWRELQNEPQHADLARKAELDFWERFLD